MTTFIDSVWVVVDRHTLTAHSYIRRKVADMTGAWATTLVTPLHRLCGPGSAAVCRHASQRRQWRAPSIYDDIYRFPVGGGEQTHTHSSRVLDGRLPRTAGRRQRSRHRIGSVGLPLFAATRVNDDSGELLFIYDDVIRFVWIVVDGHAITAHLH
jgi:hypothetical protein